MEFLANVPIFQLFLSRAIGSPYRVFTSDRLDPSPVLVPSPLPQVCEERDGASCGVAEHRGNNQTISRPVHRKQFLDGACFPLFSPSPLSFPPSVRRFAFAHIERRIPCVQPERSLSKLYGVSALPSPPPFSFPESDEVSDSRAVKGGGRVLPLVHPAKQSRFCVCKEKKGVGRCA